MSNSHHDQNNKPTFIGMLNTNGTTIVAGKVDPVAHYIYIVDGTGTTDHGPANSRHDGNGQPILMGVSSADFKTPVAIYFDSSNQLLIKT